MDVLAGIEPTLVKKFGQVQAAMLLAKRPIKAVCGVRTAQEQYQRWLQGRGLPGPIVTYCDGVMKKSNHQVHDDGWGHAIDVAADGPVAYPKDFPWSLFGAVVEQAGLVWGGRFRHPVDLDHMELP